MFGASRGYLSSIGFWILILTLIALGGWFVLPRKAEEPRYRTEEFQVGDSRIPVVFACMFAAHKSGVSPDANELALEMMLKGGATPEKVDQWAKDAVVYVSVELQGTDWAVFWRESCAKPFETMKETLEAN